MADEKDDTTKSECSVCGKKFPNIQECLKHELIDHSLQKKSGQQNRLQKRINATARLLNSEEKRAERQHLEKQLNKCRNGAELKTIFALFCMNTDNLGLIFTRIQTCLEKELQTAGVARIYPFGSIASGLALRDCDIDIYLDVSGMITASHQKTNKRKGKELSNLTKAYNCINKLLHRSNYFTDVYAIRHARVPIIKCQHKDTGFSIDINISYPSSRENTQFIHDLVNSDARIHELMLFLKLWAKMTQIIGRDVMTSYCLITMIIFFLQQPRQWKVNEGNDDDGRADGRILKPINELQENRTFHMVQGVNYAYDLKSAHNRPHIPAGVTTWDLIKEFFQFYANFNFEDTVISPFYGEAINKSLFSPATCEAYYRQLKTITQYMEGQPANDLKTECCMCVQDAFCLNQNTAKNISPQNKPYILLCLQNAKKICENTQGKTLAQLYTQLLFDTIFMDAGERREKTELPWILQRLKVSSTVADKPNGNNDSLRYIVIPSKADLCKIATQYPDIVNDDILQYWYQKYMRAITIILTELYHVDISKQLPTQQKQMKLDQEENENNLNSSWAISCTIDLWTNRCFQKNMKKTFMAYQLEQTVRLQSLRRQDPKFSVMLNGVLKLNALPGNMGIEITFQLPQEAAGEILTKKSPIRKFFNVFKNTLQNLTFKEILNIDVANAETNEKTENTDTVIMTVDAQNSTNNS